MAQVGEVRIFTFQGLAVLDDTNTVRTQMLQCERRQFILTFGNSAQEHLFDSVTEFL